MAFKLGPRQEEPSSESREKAEAILKQLDPLLGIVWLPFARYDEKRDEWEGRYALTCTWPQVDKRWELYRSGDLGEPFDILGMFEEDGKMLTWHSVGSSPVLDPMSVMDSALEVLGKMDLTRQDWKERVKKNAEHNKALAEKRRKDMIGDVVHGMVEERRRVTHAPLVVGADLERPQE